MQAPGVQPHRSTRRACGLLITLLLGLTPAAQAAPPEDFSDKFLQLGTGPRGGAFRPIGESLCDAVNEDRKTSLVRCVAVGTAGSTFNLHAVSNGGMQIGLAQEDLVADLYTRQRKTGTSPLRVIAVLHTSPIAVVAHRDAGVQSLAQIAGKRMNLGNRGSGQFAITAALLRALDLKPEQLGAASYLATSEMDKAFCERKVDVVVEAVAHPSPLFEKLLACGGQFIDIPPETIARMVAENRLLSAMSIPALTYPAQTAAVGTLGMRNVLFTSAAVNEEAVYRLTRTLARRYGELLATQPLLGSMAAPGAPQATPLPAPLHAGAARALRGTLQAEAR
jgi:TRAP transporter TAXI family solute receptor